eukprot:CAMPEP_0178514588 /NCGR_PEP_ID=MMETSP0696-20121128/24093_1 /TAXON_ID=265572 /ORGANISM="Extubocellulus spinifer, Strain CCMP396" /LENGTH=975 /DNA_ID=CAMNT_0020144673 /DNA_START=1 /DNA_END=2928 /DNA_ORIENTATION=+
MSNEEKQKTIPAVGGRPPHLCPATPTPSPKTALPRPTLHVAAAPTMASEKAEEAPVLKPRQVTAEITEGVLGGAAAASLAPPDLRRTTTGSAAMRVEYPSLTVREVSTDGYKREKEEEEKGRMRSSERPTPEFSFGPSRSCDVSNQVDKMLSPCGSYNTTTSCNSNASQVTGCAKAGLTDPTLRRYRGTLCLNTADITDRDGLEDEPLAVFRDSLSQQHQGRPERNLVHQRSTAFGFHAPSSMQQPMQQPQQQVAPGVATREFATGPAVSRDASSALSVACLAQRALEAHVRAEAAILQLLEAEQGGTSISASVPVGALAGGGVYPMIPARVPPVATTSVFGAAETSGNRSAGDALEVLLERQQTRERLLAADVAAIIQTEQRYANPSTSSASPGLHALLGMNCGTSYGLGLVGMESSHDSTAAVGNPADLRELVEKEEDELHQLQLKLQEQQQELRRHQQCLLRTGDLDETETGTMSNGDAICERRAGPLKKRLKRSHDANRFTDGAYGGEKCTRGQTEEATNSLDNTSSVPRPGACVPSKRILLYSPEDHHWLSDQLCSVRKLIEIFEATEEDVTARSRRGGMKKPIQVGRVGLRCIYCSNVPARQRAKGAVSYPNSIRIVHQAVRNFQRYHLMQCPNMPQKIKDEYEGLKTTRCHSGNASLQYWITSCHALGMFDTDPDNGIHLRQPPPREALELQFVTHGPMPRLESSASTSVEVEGLERQSNAASASYGSPMEARASPPTLTSHEIAACDGSDRTESDFGATTDSCGLLISGSKEDNATKGGRSSHQGIVAGNLQATPYMNLILAQQRPTKYQPADSLGKRRPRPSGFSGMECKHCSSPSRVASPGRYFPLTPTVLANNNNPGGCVYIHLMKCGRCPQDIKSSLQELAERHAKDGELLERGWRRKLFIALWDRLHKGSPWTNVLLQPQDDEKRPRQEDGSDDVGEAALALSSLSGFAGYVGTKRKAPSDK